MPPVDKMETGMVSFDSKVNYTILNHRRESMNNPGIEFAHKTASAYSAACKPLCQQLHLPQTAFDILMFLANNPGYQTASDIVEVRKLKANLVSVNVDRLVQESYLAREADPADRRRVLLRCTEKAQPIIKRGRALQEDFGQRLLEHTTKAQRKAFFETMELIDKNLDAILEGEN